MDMDEQAPVRARSFCMASGMAGRSVAVRHGAMLSLSVPNYACHHGVLPPLIAVTVPVGVRNRRT
jgi:hypothetical protein